MNLANTSNPCPECRKTREIREIWPRVDVLNVIDDTVLPKDIEDAGKVKLVLYCSIFDFLFEDFLGNLLRKINTPLELIDFILDSTSAEKRRSLFKYITKEKLNNVWEQNKFPDFIRDFIILKEKRDKFVHKTFFIDFNSLIPIFETIAIFLPN